LQLHYQLLVRMILRSGRSNSSQVAALRTKRNAN
jgi:hypothetical protein